MAGKKKSGEGEFFYAAFPFINPLEIGERDFFLKASTDFVEWMNATLQGRTTFREAGHVQSAADYRVRSLQEILRWRRAVVPFVRFTSSLTKMPRI